MYLLGIDIGTTNWKAVLYDGAGNAVAQSATPTLTHYGDAGEAVYHADEIWRGVCQLLQDIIAQGKQQARGRPFQPAEIKGVAVTGMGETVVPVDAGGRPLYDAIAWFDPRTEPQYRWLKAQYGSAALFEITGVPLTPIFSLNKILWIRDNAPEVFRQSYKWLTMPDWIMLKLSGEYATEYSEATRTMCFDICAKRWSAAILDFVGLDQAQFPALYPSGTVIGKVHRQASQETGLAVGTPVVTGGHDHICGALAMGVFQAGPALDSCGTSESLMLSLDQVELTAELHEKEMVYGCHVAREKYSMIAGLYTSGVIVRWFQEQFAPATVTDAEAYQRLLAEAQQIAPGAEGVFFLPHFRGASTTPVDPLSRSTFIGILSHHARGHLFRAIIEGLCYEVRRLLEIMEASACTTVKQLRFIGSARNEFWLQAKADILNRSLEVPAVTEGTCLGAALLAGIGVGVYRDEQEAFQQAYRRGKIYEPAAENIARYDTFYHEIFTDIYPTLAPLHHKIAKVLHS